MVDSRTRSQDSNPNDSDAAGSSILLFPAIVMVWIVILFLGSLRYQGPVPKPDSIADDQFSAFRAYKILDVLVGDGIPHESGSEQNKLVRKRVIDFFESFGYDVEQQECEGAKLGEGKLVPLVNLITRLNGKNHGTEDERIVVVLSHYDSKPGAVGAADDGVGVAVSLEVAQMLKSSRRLNHDIVFVVTDGEEFGLLGAQGFVNHHPLAKQIDLVINLEARGTSGPSIMFETNSDNSQVIPLFARSSERPFCSSLFFEFYKRMPNDTDFSIFKEAGVPGYNFAFIGDVKNYHTMEDRLQNVDKKSIQHQGDNLWSLLHEVDQQTTFRPDETENQFVVYFDLWGWKVFYWSPFWSVLMWIVGLVAVGSANVLVHKPITKKENEKVFRWLWRRLWYAESFSAFVFTFATLMLMCLAAISLHFGLKSGEVFGPGWVNDAVFVELGYWLVAASVPFSMVWLLGRHHLLLSSLGWVASLWLTISVGLIIFLPGAVYLFIVPLVVASLISVVLALCFRGRALTSIIFVFAFCVGVIWLPLEQLFYDALGFKMPVMMIGRVIVVSAWLVPVALATHKKYVPVYACLLAALSFATALFSVIWQ